MPARPARNPLDADCPVCLAPRGVRCHPVDDNGVHHMSRPLDAADSHPPRFHAVGMFCPELCDDCPQFTTEVTYEDAEDDE